MRGLVSHPMALPGKYAFSLSLASTVRPHGEKKVARRMGRAAAKPITVSRKPRWVFACAQPTLRSLDGPLLRRLQAAGLIPPRTRPRHQLVVAFEHLDRNAGAFAGDPQAQFARGGAI